MWGILYLLIGVLLFWLHAHNAKRKMYLIHFLALTLAWPLILVNGFLAMKAERKKRT